MRSDAIQLASWACSIEHIAFSLALILDELARHLADLNGPCAGRPSRYEYRLLLGEQLDSPAIRHTRRR